MFLGSIFLMHSNIQNMHSNEFDIVLICKKMYNIYCIMGENMEKLLIYSFITMTIIIISLIIINKRVKNQRTKDQILKMTAVVTVFLHYSSLWVDYFTTGKAEVNSTMLIPVYPCNVCMWMLLIVAFTKNKDSKIYHILTEFLGLAGTVCGMIGLFFNDIFLSDPNFFDYSSLKGLLSHSTMIFGTLFILTQGYVKIETISMTISTTIGLVIFAIDGLIVNTLFSICKLDSVNSMYMQEFPFDIPGGSFITLGILGVLVAFIFSNIYELISKPSNERWYHKLRNK